MEQARLAGLAEFTAQLHPYLAPDEALHAVVSARLDSGIKDPPGKLLPKNPGPLGALGGAIERAAPVIAPTETVITGILNIASGKVWGGDWESQAGRLIIAIYPLKRAEGSTILGASLVIAVTDLRTMVVFLPRRAAKLPPGVIAEFAPHQLRNRAEARPKKQKHRTDVVFPDGSWIAFQTGSPQQADVLRQFLGTPA
jgi:hypothetical protein